MSKKYKTTIKLNDKSRNARSSKGFSSSRLTKSEFYQFTEKVKAQAKSKLGDRFARFGKSTQTKSKAKGKSKPSFSTWRDSGKSRGKLAASATVRQRIGGKLPRVTKSKRLMKGLYIMGMALFVLFFTGTLGALAYMQNLTKDLPDPERPFENERFAYEASIMYDRNGRELFRLFDDDNRDIVQLEDGGEIDEVIPQELKWAFLAAEDIDFYNHPGFDVQAIVRCSLGYITSGEANCGGSTITQQVVKQAALEDNTRSVDRKLRELVLSLQLENQVRDKDKILLLYMNISPMGSNLYGVKTASEFYFDKPLEELTLEESVVLAAIPNNPAILSPTRSVNPELGDQLLDVRVSYIYDQLERYQDRINQEVREYREAKAEEEGRELTEEEQEDFITAERIAQARETELDYAPGTLDIKAPHFVFFAKDLLTSRPYNAGEAFTDTQISTGGYSIYTTLDTDIQDVALDVVQNVAMTQYAPRYGNSNASLLAMKADTGEIIAMVGSRCYDNNELENCSELAESQGDKFDPQVNIMNTQQQPGSSIKPFVYLESFERGQLAPGSIIADVPIEIGDYKPVNSDRRFIGLNTVRYMLALSRNTPAIQALVASDPASLASLKADLGYTTNIDPSTYGPSAALGSQDVLGVEHAAAFAALGRGGKYQPYEAILRIEDKNGNVIYELGSDEEGKDYRGEPQQVVDERAAFLVNDSTNPNSDIIRNQSPVKWNDDRDMAGKTGTSENNRDVWFANYSPDFVFLGWAGNNDNQRMAGGAFGSTNAEPWVREFAQRVGSSEYFGAKTPFSRPGGISIGRICGNVTVNGSEREVCEGNNDYYISDLRPPIYRTKQIATVCTDQPDRLAREIDIQTGNAQEREFDFMRAVASPLQDSIDKYFRGKQGANGAPTENCDVNRSPNGANPWALINSPVPSTTYTDSFSANIIGYATSGSVTKMELSLGGELLQTVNTSSYLGTLEIPDSLISGNYPFQVKVFDSNGRTGVSQVTISISGFEPTLQVVAPGAGTTKPVSVALPVTVNYDSGLTGIEICYQGPSESSPVCISSLALAGSASATFTPSVAGEYTIFGRASGPVAYTGPAITITVE